MAKVFDTVSDVREWLNNNPPIAEVDAALEAEKDGSNRVTAKGAMQDYLEENLEESEETDEELKEVAEDEEDQEEEEVESEESGDGVEFRVQKPFDGHSTGDTVRLDPDESECDRLRRGGFIALL